MMTIPLKFMGLLLLLTMGLSFPARSQVTTTADYSNIIDICTAEEATIESCQAAISTYLTTLQAAGIGQLAIDAAMSDLAASLHVASQSRGTPVVVASALNYVSDTISDPARRAAVTQLASDVASEAGEPVTPIASPISASPS
ncbi:hypothetical protein [Pelagibacterium halotolerans]|uniref:hypothetical protein n=1 Tax=Pelagibacterium halotolerans TaxID=531813 RepID=UPI00384EDF02